MIEAFEMFAAFLSDQLYICKFFFYFINKEIYIVLMKLKYY